MAVSARSQDGGRRATIAAGLALVALTTAVAVTSRADLGRSAGGASPRSGAAHVGESALLGFGIVAWVVVTGLVVTAVWPALRRRTRDPEDDRDQPYTPDIPLWEKLFMVMLPALVFAAILVGVVGVSGSRGGGAPAPAPLSLGSGQPVSDVSTTSAPPATSSAGGGGSAVIADAAICAAAILAAAGGILFVRARRRRRRGISLARARAAVVQAVEWSLDDLRREPDPRRAVIAAYARMERMLADDGIGRHPFEAPLEYLRRVLAQAHVDAAPIAGLTHLFQEARFSPHTVAGGDRERAVQALTAIRDGLERG